MTVTTASGLLPIDVISCALLALAAMREGNDAEAHACIARAQRLGRTCPRRDRQIVEIAASVVAGKAERGAGLALVHVAEFPHDAGLLARMTGAGGPER